MAPVGESISGTPDRGCHRSRVRRILVVPGSFRVSARSLGVVTTCDFCGRQEADDAATLTWTTSVENGRKRVFCDTCSRANLRAMESKLDSEFW